MNANNKEYTLRKLTEEEQAFAADEVNYNYLFFYMRKWHLDPEEWYDLLIEPYLNAVKKYHEYESARQYAFSTVLKNMLWTAITRELKKQKAKKRMPDGGFVSLDFMSEGDNPFSKYHTKEVESWWIDTRASVERQVIQKELYKEFYRKCITIVDDFDGEEEICEYLKYELDLLLDGYTHKKAHREAEKNFNYGYTLDDFERDVEGFRRIFKQVFGI
jgi:hypothetical protein